MTAPQPPLQTFSHIFSKFAGKLWHRHTNPDFLTKGSRVQTLLHLRTTSSSQIDRQDRNHLPHRPETTTYPDRRHFSTSSSQSSTDTMSHESVWNSRPRGYGKGARSWYEYTDPRPGGEKHVAVGANLNTWATEVGGAHFTAMGTEANMRPIFTAASAPTVPV